MADEMYIDDIEIPYESEEDQLKHDKNIDKFYLQKRVMVEKVRKFNITDRDLMVLSEIYYGQMIPVWLIAEMHFKGTEAYKKKRLAALRRHGLIGTSIYVTVDGDGKKTRGGLHYMTNSGINTVETIQGSRERLTRVRIPEYTASDKKKYLQIAELRFTAFQYEKEWLYGKQVRESVYIKHNLQIEAQVDNLCIFVLKERPSRRGLIHLKTSISKLAGVEHTDHLVVCDPADRVGIMQFLSMHSDDDLLGPVVNGKQDLWILTQDESVQHLRKRFEGVRPHDNLVNNMREHGLETVAVENDEGITPYVIRHGNEKYYLADFTDYNILELIRVMDYRSELFKRYDGPDGVLMQVKDIGQLKEIATLLRTTVEAQGHIKYMLAEPHNGSNMFSIEDGCIMARR